MMHDLWAGAGFTKIESRAISVTRSFESFEEFWTISTNGTGMRPIIEAGPGRRGAAQITGERPPPGCRPDHLSGNCQRHQRPRAGLKPPYLLRHQNR
jgi:hypothetical protein